MSPSDAESIIAEIADDVGRRIDTHALRCAYAKLLMSYASPAEFYRAMKHSMGVVQEVHESGQPLVALSSSTLLAMQCTSQMHIVAMAVTLERAREELVALRAELQAERGESLL